jgi:CRP-like cAMP-binding protein
VIGTTPERTGNLILDALPASDRHTLLARTRRDAFRPEDVVVQAGQRIDRVLFPVTAVVSLLTTLSDGTAVETATVGREGMVGVAVFLQDDHAPNSRAVIQLGGEALSIGADDFRACLGGSAKLENLMFSYTRALLLQFGQSVACTASHPIPERLARWLLQTTDRVGSERVQLTQEFIADILGVRRASVTDSLRSLRRDGSIETHRGSIEIVGRDRLRGAACECYAFLHEEYARIYGAP